MADKLFTESPINLMTRKPSLTRLRSCEWPLHRNAESKRRSKLSQTALEAPISFSVIHDRELTQRNPIPFARCLRLLTELNFLISGDTESVELPAGFLSCRRCYNIECLEVMMDQTPCSILSLDSEVQGRMEMDQKE